MSPIPSNVVGDNWLIRQFEDDSHSLEFGLNAATPILELIAVKNAGHVTDILAFLRGRRSSGRRCPARRR